MGLWDFICEDILCPIGSAIDSGVCAVGRGVDSVVTQLRDKPRPSGRGRIARAGEEGLVSAEARRISP